MIRRFVRRIGIVVAVAVVVGAGVSSTVGSPGQARVAPEAAGRGDAPMGGMSWVCLATAVGYGLAVGNGDVLGQVVCTGLWYANGC
jgi:hypothetical protein